MSGSITNKRYLYIRWFLLRFGLVVYDILAVNAAYYLALLVRFYVNYEFNIWAVKYVPAFFQFAPFYTCCCLAVFGVLGFYKSLWKYASMHDMNRILLASAITCGIQIAGTLLFVMRMPISYYALGAAFQFVLITISRFSYRLILIERGQFSRLTIGRHQNIRVMVVGSGESSRTVIKHLERDVNHMFKPVCAVDFENRDFRGTMAGVPVIGGIAQVKNAVKKYKIHRVVLADTAMPDQIRKEVRELCKEAGVAVQNYSDFFQSASGKIPLQMLLEYVNGPVVLKIDENTFRYEDPEQAAVCTTEKYIVSSVSINEGALQIELVPDALMPNDIQAEWVERYREEMGEDISFF